MKRKRAARGPYHLRILAILFAFSVFALNYSPPAAELRELPGAYYAVSREELVSKLGASFTARGLAVTADVSGDEKLAPGTVSCRLWGVVLKRVPAYVGERATVVPGGQAVGISIHTDGVLVVGTAAFKNAGGRSVSPAADAGIKPGDVILLVNGEAVSSSQELASAMDGSPLGAELTVLRDGEKRTFAVTPEESAEGGLRIGAWVRDSTVGIGTLSFYDPETDALAALGHAVLDADTGSLLTVRDGELVIANVLGVTKGRQGSPGELHGNFGSGSPKLGRVTENTGLGIFGMMYEGAEELLSGAAVMTAFPDEVHTGPAVIVTSAFGEPEEYSCRIIKTGRQNEPAPKGLVIEITDERLIERTGGIVQGMSGSPILQDGMLVGVVTHVFVSDPKKGYGAYAYWMYKLTGGQTWKRTG
ncbi:MAG: SpoIVB peptidase [Clostridia bacterium]|nr:SpoIVB peptidase [Clostridia bacterium]